MFKPQFLADFPVLGPVPAKAALIAAPVVIHPQMAQEHFPADPLLPAFDRVMRAFDAAMGSVAPEQSIVIVDRLISPAWVAKACSQGNELQTATMLVTGHCMEREDPYFILEDWIQDDGIEASKGTLGFIVGAVYRQEEDPNPVSMLSPGDWEHSVFRHQVEAALSVGPSLLRHQVLAPMPAEEALMAGFEGLCRMYAQFHGDGAQVGADMRADGRTVLTVQTGVTEMEFVLDPAVMPVQRVERLLRRLEALPPPRLPAPGAAASRVVH